MDGQRDGIVVAPRRRPVGQAGSSDPSSQDNPITRVSSGQSHRRSCPRLTTGANNAHGIERLRIADGSIMPRVTAGNTMAPCVIIGECAASILKAPHTL